MTKTHSWWLIQASPYKVEELYGEACKEASKKQSLSKPWADDLETLWVKTVTLLAHI